MQFPPGGGTDWPPRLTHSRGGEGEVKDTAGRGSGRNVGEPSPPAEGDAGHETGRGGGGKGGGKGWAGRAGSGSSTGRRAKWDVDGGEGRKGRAAGGGRAHDTGSSSVPQTVCRGGGEGWMHTYQGDLSCAPAPPLRSHLSLATRLQLSAAPPPTPSRAAISHGLCSFSHEASWPWPLGRPGRFRRRG